MGLQNRRRGGGTSEVLPLQKGGWGRKRLSHVEAGNSGAEVLPIMDGVQNVSTL